VFVWCMVYVWRYDVSVSYMCEGSCVCMVYGVCVQCHVSVSCICEVSCVCMVYMRSIRYFYLVCVRDRVFVLCVCEASCVWIVHV